MNDNHATTFCEPIYKGLIDPPTILGIPMMPMLIVSVLAFELASVGFLIAGPGVFVAVAIVYAWTFSYLRQLGANDIQRVRQTMLRAQIRWGQALSRRRWGAISFGPVGQRRI